MTKIVPMSPDEAPVPSFEAPDDSPMSWLQDMAATIHELLLARGAVLLHGMPMEGPDSLARARERLGFGGFTPTEVFNRRTDFGNGILSPISWPQNRHICPLQESSFSTTYPSVVLTACVTPPEGAGRAHLSDARQMVRHLPTDLADAVRSSGWTMVRNFHGGFGLSWREAFSVPDRAALEDLFEAEEIQSEWFPSGLLHTVRRRPGFVKHPETGEECWFNQLAFLNAGSLDAAERGFMTKAFGRHLPMDTFFGDGSPLSEEDLAAIDDAYDATKVEIPWRRGDLLITDNITMAHGRSAIEGSPEFLVALGRVFKGSQPLE
ncbi:TauD/TfdA family dioxygenase [Micromonospora sp. NPDC005298]|uniref:TauD/TfdA family dioxygenase n=1 Tax=Micromonospora sp. NPDC005298 TaxID=3156873 RepID=UPI0033AD14A3